MVKGISKRVIIVKPPVNSMFEQAIFILKENSFSGASVNSSDIIAEARAVVDDYVRTHCGKRRKRSKRSTYIAALSSVITLVLCGLFYIFFL
ncbi:MAG: translation initiation factor 2 [Oscillospiraceae bacterium]|nr:translation initiation factor 2 [Oscillospiraceae bacterium]MBQ6847024.1 translation initiation factor 2 [Oscillospiraceae bacterium]MBQ7119117.1 translation initiation factor 2 [Oscillospiraceae bacterium]